jgi:tetratricopeptide (TPR) repeat protein
MGAEKDAHRAESLARNGQWGLAAAAFGKAVERAPDDLQLHGRYLLSLLEAGDLRGSRRPVSDLLTQVSKTTAYYTARDAAWYCALVPAAVTDADVLVRLADSAVSWTTEAFRDAALVPLGAALYRAGRFEEAIRRLDESVRANSGGSPQAWAFLAMAHHRLGHGDEAKRWLDRLLTYQPKKGADFSWDDVEVRILRREAESVVLGSHPAATPSSLPAPAQQGRNHP